MSIDNNTPDSGSAQMNNNPISMLFELAGTAKDVISEYQRRGQLVSDENKMNIRMELCAGCKCFDKASARCSLCGCFMKVKVRLEASKCPVGKW